MRIDVHTNLRQPQSLEVTRLVVFDVLGNAVAAVMELPGGGVMVMEAANTPAWHGLMRQLGVAKTSIAIVGDVQERPIGEIVFDR